MAKTDLIPYKSPAKNKHIGVGIIEQHDGKVLIALRQKTHAWSLWEFLVGNGKRRKHSTNSERSCLKN